MDDGTQQFKKIYKKYIKEVFNRVITYYKIETKHDLDVLKESPYLLFIGQDKREYKLTVEECKGEGDLITFNLEVWIDDSQESYTFYTDSIDCNEFIKDPRTRNTLANELTIKIKEVSNHPFRFKLFDLIQKDGKKGHMDTYSIVTDIWYSQGMREKEKEWVKQEYTIYNFSSDEWFDQTYIKLPRDKVDKEFYPQIKLANQVFEDFNYPPFIIYKYIIYQVCQKLYFNYQKINWLSDLTTQEEFDDLIEEQEIYTNLTLPNKEQNPAHFLLKGKTLYLEFHCTNFEFKVSWGTTLFNDHNEGSSLIMVGSKKFDIKGSYGGKVMNTKEVNALIDELVHFYNDLAGFLYLDNKIDKKTTFIAMNHYLGNDKGKKVPDIYNLKQYNFNIKKFYEQFQIQDNVLDVIDKKEFGTMHEQYTITPKKYPFYLKDEEQKISLLYFSVNQEELFDNVKEGMMNLLTDLLEGEQLAGEPTPEITPIDLTHDRKKRIPDSREFKGGIPYKLKKTEYGNYDIAFYINADDFDDEQLQFGFNEETYGRGIKTNISIKTLTDYITYEGKKHPVVEEQLLKLLDEVEDKGFGNWDVTPTRSGDNFYISLKSISPEMITEELFKTDRLLDIMQISRKKPFVRKKRKPRGKIKA